MKSRQVLKILPREVKAILESMNIRFENLQEIRIRIGQPIIFLCQGREIISSTVANENLLRETMNYVSNYSLYAYEHELKQGFITVEGGHRVGVAGVAVVEGGKIKNLK